MRNELTNLIRRVGLKAFSESIGVHPTSAARYARGARRPNDLVVKKIRRAYGLSLEQIRPDLFDSD